MTPSLDYPIARPTDDAVSKADRLSDRGDHGDALPPWTGRSGRRCVGLYRSPSGGAAETESLGLHQRKVREDPGTPAGPRAGLLGFAGRARRGAGAPRPDGRDLQPA